MVTLYRLDAEPALDRPVMIAALDGWVDAGSAGTAAAEQLADGGRLIASFDADRIYDYRVRRPTLEIQDGTMVGFEWPDLTVRATRLEERDLLVLTGPEPDYRWKQLGADVAALAAELRVSSWVSLGAIPAAVAHTRPVPVLGTASATGLLPEGVAKGPAGTLRVPSAALSVFEHAVTQAGIPTLGLFAQVPHYLSGAYPTAAIELLTHLGHYLALEIPLGALPGKALETRAMLDAASASDERTQAYIQRLEQLTDEARLPEGDELIADIERFLRDRGTGNGGEGGSRLN